MANITISFVELKNHPKFVIFHNLLAKITFIIENPLTDNLEITCLQFCRDEDVNMVKENCPQLPIPFIIPLMYVYRCRDQLTSIFVLMQKSSWETFRN